jgi:hypothetical protein
MPRSLITPVNTIAAGVGATAYASASQKWKGTIAALTRKPPVISANATTTSSSLGACERASPTWARLRAPVRP